jgi:hypothetical protein
MTIKQQRKKKYNQKPGKANMKKTHEFSVGSELAVNDFLPLSPSQAECDKVLTL